MMASGGLVFPLERAALMGRSRKGRRALGRCALVGRMG